MSKSQNGKTLNVTGHIVSYEWCKRIASIDSLTVSNDPTKYACMNATTYYVAINAWLLLCKDITGDDRLTLELSDYIRSKGLFSTISICNDLANDLISHIAGISWSFTIDTPQFALRLTQLDDVSQILQILRFLKRFSPAEADLLRENAINKFASINRRCREFNGANQVYYLESSIGRYLEEILEHFSDEYDPTDMRFSNGACQDGNVLSKKLSAYAKTEPYWISPHYPIGNPDRITSTKGVYAVGKTGKLPYSVIPIPVPKTFRTARIIAPEASYQAAHLQAIRKAAERSLARSRFHSLFDPETQADNQDLAREGSVSGAYATIDLSSASDSIPRSFAFRVLPLAYTNAIYPFLNTHLYIGDRSVRCNMFAPSGNPVTFVSEGMIFLATFLTANDIYYLLTGEEPLDPHIFGDDGVCDVRVFSLVCDILERLGFVVNDEKSFSQGSTYRESCGVEYSLGLPLHTKYWPRKTLGMLDYCTYTPEAIGQLCSLQHRLYNYWYTQRFLSETVVSQLPGMTSSLPGTECSDLWAAVPIFGKRRAPVGVVDNTTRTIRTKGVPIQVEDAVLLREAHMVLENVAKDTADRNVDMYDYVKFLKHGPEVSDDPVFQLLGISEKKERIGSTVKSELTWRKTVR